MPLRAGTTCSAASPVSSPTLSVATYRAPARSSSSDDILLQRAIEREDPCRTQLNDCRSPRGRITVTSAPALAEHRIRVHDVRAVVDGNGTLDDHRAMPSPFVAFHDDERCVRARPHIPQPGPLDGGDPECALPDAERKAEVSTTSSAALGAYQASPLRET